MYVCQFNFIVHSRVGMVHELILGIRLVKILTWERPSSEKMLMLRKKELKKLLHTLTINAVNFMLLDVSPLIVAVATLAVYVEKPQCWHVGLESITVLPYSVSYTKCYQRLQHRHPQHGIMCR